MLPLFLAVTAVLAVVNAVRARLAEDPKDINPPINKPSDKKLDGDGAGDGGDESCSNSVAAFATLPDAAHLQALLVEKTAELARLANALAEKATENAQLKEELATKENKLVAIRSDSIRSDGGSSSSSESPGTDGWEEDVEEEEQGGAGGDEAHTDQLPSALRNFKIISDYPAVAELVTGAGDERRRRLEDAVIKYPSNAEAVSKLANYVAELQAATQKSIDASLSEPGLFRHAFEAMTAGNDTFKGVYESVWNLVNIIEPEEIESYTRQVTAAVARLPNEKQQQTVSTIHELFRDAAITKPNFDAIVSNRLFKRLQTKRKAAATGAHIFLCATPGKVLKKTTRLCEKFACAHTAAGISDVVRGMIAVKSMDGVNAVLEMLLELEKENVIKIVRLKDRFTAPSSGGWRDLMVNLTIVGDATNHICELQVVHDNMMVARKGLPGHAVYNRARNAVELLGVKFGSVSVACDALALAGVLVGMGGGSSVEKVGFVESRSSRTSNGHNTGGWTWTHRDHISGEEVFLADKGWLSDAPLKEWLGVRVDEHSGRVTHVELKDRGLVGSIPSVLVGLTELEYLDMRTNEKISRPIGLVPSRTYPTGELGLLDMTGQVHYTSKVRCQQFLQYLKLSKKEQHSALLVAKHGRDGPALRRFFDANNKFRGWSAAADRQRWFESGIDDISKWHGVVVGKDGCVVKLTLFGFGFTNTFEIDGLAEMDDFKVLDLSMCGGLTALPESLGQLTKLEELNLSGGRFTITEKWSFGMYYPSNYPVKLTSLPDCLGKLTNLKKLILNRCMELSSFPDLSHLLPSLQIENSDQPFFVRRRVRVDEHSGQVRSLGGTSQSVTPAVTAWVKSGCKALSVDPCLLIDAYSGKYDFEINTTNA